MTIVRLACAVACGISVLSAMLPNTRPQDPYLDAALFGLAAITALLALMPADEKR